VVKDAHSLPPTDGLVNRPQVFATEDDSNWFLRQVAKSDGRSVGIMLAASMPASSYQAPALYPVPYTHTHTGFMTSFHVGDFIALSL